MKAQETYLLRFIEGHDKCFKIPVYQRNYDWKYEQCQQLLNDICEIARRKRDTYFIGSIVSIHDDDANGQEYVIIDGQQRITTVTLLLMAIYNLIKQGQANTSIPLLDEQIRDNYLVNKYSSDDKKIRLKPIKDDNLAYVSLFDGNSSSKYASSNIVINYNYFFREISSGGLDISVDEIYSAIKKLMIVDIKLKRGEDNPQLIFESLNSTGKQLEEGDLVRNFVLMDKPPEVQEKLYNKYWNPIEKNTEFQVGSFIRDFMTLETGVVPSKERIYHTFKEFTEDNKIKTNEEMENFLIKLLKFSKYYNYIISSSTKYPSINNSLNRLARVQVTVANPFLLDVFDALDSELISFDETTEVLHFIEAFVLRRLICNVPTNGMNKVFSSLGKKIRKASTEENASYFEVFKFYISSGSGSSRFPQDNEFENEMLLRDIYSLQAKNKNYILERLENFNNKEKVNLDDVECSLTIEHVMPQTLSKPWKDDLGNNWQLVHEKYLNTLGNLTLTGYNREMSNSIFSKKLNDDNGFKNSRLLLNKYISSRLSWGENEIIERCRLLTNRAFSIWQFPKSTYSPSKKEYERIDIFDETRDFSNLKPMSFSLFETEYKANSWRELYTSFFKVIENLDSSALVSAFRNNSKLSRFISLKENAFPYKMEMKNGLYLNTKFSANAMVAGIRLLLEEIKWDDVSLLVNIKTVNKDINN